MLDDYEPPTLKDRLLHPVSIAMILLVALVGGFWGWGQYQQMQREALDEALEPLRAEWSEVRSQAPARLGWIETRLTASPSPSAGDCGALEGTIEVVHRPVLEALLADDSDARVEAPAWLSSVSFRYLDGDTSPGGGEQSYRRRNEEVAAALERPCVAVLETEVAEDARVQGKRFEGGAVLGRLRVVCQEHERVVCEASIVSQPMIAVSVVQRDRRAQASANAMAASDSSRSAYWRQVQEALAEIAPKLTVRSEAAD